MSIKGSRLIREMKTGQSVFMRIFLLMAALIVVLSFCMMELLNGIARNNDRRILAESTLNRLEIADRALNQNIRSTANLMTEMVWGKDLLDYLISAGGQNEARDYRIIRQLRNSTMGSNNIVKTMYFGSFYNKKLYYSDSYKQLDGNYCEAWLLVKTAMESGDYYDLGRDRDTSTDRYLIHRGSRLFLRVDLRLSTTERDPLGTILCEFDEASLAESLFDAADETSGQIYVFDREGEPMLDRVLDYSVLPRDIMDNEPMITFRNLQSGKLQGEYCYHEGAMGCQYLVKADMSGIRVSLTDTAAVAFPMLILLLLVVLSIVFYAVRILYHPIDELLDQVAPVSSQGRSRAMFSTEPVEVLADAYTAAQDRQQHLQHTIEALAPSVLESTLRQMLDGKVYTEENLEEIFEGIGVPIPRQGRYVVCTCVIEKPEHRTVSAREWNLYMISLQKLIHEFHIEAEICQTIRMDHRNLAVLLIYPENVSVVAIKKNCLELCQYLIQKSEAFPFELWADCGQILSRLTDIHESFLEGMEKLQYRRYARDSETPASSMEPSSSERTENHSGFDQRLIRDRAKEIAALSLKGERDRALAVQSGLVDELDKLSPNAEIRKKMCRAYLDDLMEKVIAYPLSAEEQRFLAGRNSIESTLEIIDDDHLGDFMTERGKYLCELLCSLGRKNQYRYVEQAKSYIEEHYANSDLALNDVAESIGISGSYLSELFNEVGGLKFSSFLAEYRVEKARQLLRVTSATIQEIGYQCGFNSVQNFIRVFKKVTGYTPGQYRELNR